VVASGLIVRLFPTSAPGFQVYDAAPLATKFKLPPGQTTELDRPKVGEGLTVTAIVWEKELGHAPVLVAETEYIPAISALALAIEGVGLADKNPFGPLQL